MTKPYKKTADVLLDLRSYIESRQKDGIFILDSERVLAQKMETCRRTLAKALKQLENEGVISRSGKVTSITLATVPAKRYAFIVNGHYANRSFWYPSEDRLWQYLKTYADKFSLSVDLLIFDPEEPGQNAAQFTQQLRGYYAVFIGLIDRKQDFSIIAEHVRNSGTHMITFCEANEVDNGILIANDGYAAGSLAARSLIQAGCKNPVMVGTMCSIEDKGMALRIQGFLDAIRESALHCPQLLFDYEHRVNVIKESLDYFTKHISVDCDAVFLPTDNWIELITADLYKRNLVPNTVKIAAVSDIGSWNRSLKSIMRVELSPENIALETIKIVQSMNECSYVHIPSKILIKPVLRVY